MNDLLHSLAQSGPARDAWLSTTIAVVLAAGAIWLVRATRRHELWSEVASNVYKRRRLSVWILALYATVAWADAVTWVGGSSTAADAVGQYEARSLIDRAFMRPRERGYSAPLDKAEFYERTPLVGRHILGTNVLGEDVLHQTLKGARVSLLIGVLTSLLTIPLALLFGVVAGYYGGRIDAFVFFVMSTLASMPGILMLVALVMVLGQSTLSVCIALGVTSWVGFAQLARGEAMKLRNLDYVLAARVLGSSDTRIIIRHILPNLMHLVIITFVLLFSGLVLSEATLSWLGIGIGGSWGQMIAQAKDELSRDPVVWWNVAPAGLALFGLLLAVNLVGDALRDALDPRLHGGRS